MQGLENQCLWQKLISFLDSSRVNTS